MSDQQSNNPQLNNQEQQLNKPELDISNFACTTKDSEIGQLYEYKIGYVKHREPVSEDEMKALDSVQGLADLTPFIGEDQRILKDVKRKINRRYGGNVDAFIRLILGNPQLITIYNLYVTVKSEDEMKQQIDKLVETGQHQIIDLKVSFEGDNFDDRFRALLEEKFHCEEDKDFDLLILTLKSAFKN